MSKNLIILVFSLLFKGLALGQVTTPDPPILNYVSVDPSNGYTHFSWKPSDSLDVVAYIIHIWTGPQDTEVVDTLIGRFTTSHIWDESWGNFGSESYSISAINSLSGDGKESKLTDPDTTMFLEAKFNPCNGQMELNWNPYGGWGDSLEHYTIYKQENSSGFVPINPSIIETSFKDEDITPYSRYCYYIEASHLDGWKSTSNMACDSSNMPKPPDYIYSVGSKYSGDLIAEFSFYVDPSTELNTYKLIRNETTTGFFDTVETITYIGGGEIILTDELPEDRPYYYYLLAMNDCDLVATRSSLNSNIRLEGENSGFYNTLSWNSFLEWTAGVDKYYIYRKAGNSEFEVIDSIASTDTIYTDNLSEIIYDIDQAEFCYYILAKEGVGNPIGLQGLSQSSTICLYPEPVVHMANAFTPNGDGINDEFKPILTFTPKEYYFIVRSRWGNTLFDTDDPNASWDGSYKGALVNEGVFVYYLKVIDQNNQVIEKNGQVMVLYPSN